MGSFCCARLSENRIPDFIVKNLFGFRSASENFSNKKFVYYSQLFLMLTKSASQTADP